MRTIVYDDWPGGAVDQLTPTPVRSSRAQRPNNSTQTRVRLREDALVG